MCLRECAVWYGIESCKQFFHQLSTLQRVFVYRSKVCYDEVWEGYVRECAV